MAGIGRRTGRMLGRAAKKQVGRVKGEVDESKGGLGGPLMGKVDVDKDRQAVKKASKKARQALLGRARRSKGSK